MVETILSKLFVENKEDEGVEIVLSVIVGLIVSALVKMILSLVDSVPLVTVVLVASVVSIGFGEKLVIIKSSKFSSTLFVISK